MAQPATILEAPLEERVVNEDDLCVVHTALVTGHELVSEHTLADILAPNYFGSMAMRMRKFDRISVTANIFEKPEFAELVVTRSTPQLREVAVAPLWQSKS